jgi:hypothetical protein
MRRFNSVLSAFLLLAVAVPVMGQQKPVLSPRDSVMLTLDTNRISVNYGRPSMRGRTIMGDLVPRDKVWRTGANEATHLKTNFDLMLGGVPVMRGTYTLWTIPHKENWTIILNKQTGQWGTRYDERQDYARFDVRSEQLAAAVETLKIALEPNGKTSGVLKLMWEKTSVAVPFEKNDKIRPVSPLDSSTVMVAGKQVKVKFSKPFARGRTIWGVVVPFDSVWRTGANSATEFSTETDLKIDGRDIPPGAYTLYTLPVENGLKLIISKKPAGRAEYDASQDLLRVDMISGKLNGIIDPMKIWFESAGRDAAILHIGWVDHSYSVDVKAK